MTESNTGQVWHLDPDFDRVLRAACTRRLCIDWAAHLPGVTPPELCP